MITSNDTCWIQIMHLVGASTFSVSKMGNDIALGEYSHLLPCPRFISLTVCLVTNVCNLPPVARD